MENEPQHTETSTQLMPATTKPIITSGRQLLRQSLGFTFANFWPLFAISLLAGLVALPGLILAFYLGTQLEAPLAVQYGLSLLVTVLSLVGSIVGMAMATRATMHAGGVATVCHSRESRYPVVAIITHHLFCVRSDGGRLYFPHHSRYRVYCLPLTNNVGSGG